MRGPARKTTLEGLPEVADSERLTLHPLLQAFAAYLLGSGPERERAEDALAEFYADYAVSAAIPNAARAIDEQNITAALDTAHARGNRDRLVSGLCWGMAQFWRDRGKYRAGLERLPWGIAAAAALAKASEAREDRVREASLVSVYGDYLQLTGRLVDASAYYEQSLAIRREVGDRRAEGVDLSGLGGVAQARGQLAEAQSYYEQSLAIDRAVGDRQGEGVVLSNLGQVAQLRGQLGEAQSYFQQSLAILQEVGGRAGEGFVLANLGRLAQMQGHTTEAFDHLRAALPLLRESDIQNYAQVSEYFGALLIEAGNRDEGCSMLAEAARLYDEMGVPGGDEVRETMRRLGCAS